MKQTFYVHQYSDGQLCFYSENKSIILPQIGTITLDVEPVKREVVKVVQCMVFDHTDCFNKKIVDPLPMGAYDVKVVYKVKE